MIKDKVYIYTDGSYNTQNLHAGYGFVVVQNDKILHEAFGSTIHDAYSRQIDGELEAAKKAFTWLKNSEYESACICFDYVGVEHWYTGSWKAKKRIAKSYVRYCNYIKDFIEVEFCHIHSHTGNKWNDYADELADKGKRVDIK